MTFTQALLFTALVLVVLFQTEVRAALMRIRYPGSIRFMRRAPKAETVDEIIDAVDRLSRSSNGAIIAIEQHMSLLPFTDNGTKLDADVSAELIVTIFTPYTPLHDGALLIRDGIIRSAGAILPLSQAVFPDRMLGTRHRAAVGLSEVTDALVIVVSEESSSISVAHKGELFRSVSTLELREILSGESPMLRSQP